MKRFLALSALFLLMMPAMGQMYVIITGTVTDSASGNPISGKPVTITSDSTYGYIYYNTVYTDANGIYGDTMNVTVSSALMYVRVWDCNQAMHQDTCNIAQGNTYFIKNFSICQLNINPCDAEFTYNVSTGLTVYFSDISNNPTGIRWWHFGDGYYDNDPNPVHTYASPGTYTVMLSIGDSLICSDYVTHDVVVMDSSGGCQAYYISYPDSLSPMTINFIDQSVSTGNIHTYTWDFGDGNSQVFIAPNSPDTQHTYLMAGTYNACLTIQGTDSSCYDTYCNTIVINQPAGCQASFTYYADTAGNMRMIHFVDSSTGQIQYWSWNFDDPASGSNNVSSLQNPGHVFSEAGIYNVCLTITGGGCTSTWCTPVTIIDSTSYNNIYGQVFEGYFPMNLGMTMIFSLDTNVNFMPYVDTYVVDSNGVFYFNWVPEGNYYIMAIPFDSAGYLPTYYGDVINWEEATLITLGEPTNPYDIHLVQASPMMPGNGNINGQISNGGFRGASLDKVMMLLMDDAGNAISFNQVTTEGGFTFPTLDYGTYYLHPEMAGVTSDYVKVELTADNPSATVSMTFSGNRILGTGDAMPKLEAGQVYPNPAHGSFSIVIYPTSSTRLTIELYNMGGQRVYASQKDVPAGRATLTTSLEGFRPGIYTLRVHSDEGIQVTRKVILVN